MKCFLLIVTFWVSNLLSNEAEVKNDNTVIVQFDDFNITTTYPHKTTNPNELTIIVKNVSKINHLLSIRKNGKLMNFISLPSQESKSETISLKNNDNYLLRPLYPPAEDIKLQSNINK